MSARDDYTGMATAVATYAVVDPLRGEIIDALFEIDLLRSVLREIAETEPIGESGGGAYCPFCNGERQGPQPRYYDKPFVHTITCPWLVATQLSPYTNDWTQP